MKVIDEGYDNYIELSDWSFRDTPEKTSFNTSMGNFGADWTSLKYQFGSDLNSIRDATCGKKSRMKNASNYRTKKRRNRITWVLDPSTEWSSKSKCQIQLLSIVCGKDADDQNVYKLNELADMFEGIALNIKKQYNKELKPHLVHQ